MGTGANIVVLGDSWSICSTTPGAQRIQAIVEVANLASVKVLIKRGFEQEGVVRAQWRQSRWHDQGGFTTDQAKISAHFTTLGIRTPSLSRDQIC